MLTTTNFSEVLAGHRRDATMQRDEIGTERDILCVEAATQQEGGLDSGRNKLDELEQLALEALDDI